MSLGWLVGETLRRDRLLATVAALHLALFVALLPFALLDPLQILGISRWIKPMKFAISIAVFTATMAWILSYLTPASSRPRRWISRTIAFTMTSEIALITMQSLRGVRSHFNHDSSFDEAVFSAMGVLIIANSLAVVWALLLFLRRPVSANGAHLAGIRLGLLLFILGSFEGGLMVALDRHSVGVGVHDGGPGLPFVNWSSGAGDLRVAHFVGMHALQALPVIGWLLDRRSVRGRAAWIVASAVVWATVTGLLVVQALAGRPLLALGR